MAYDVFISYASKDKIVADAVCARLEASGIRCWIAPRDITAGTSYGEAIIEAIHGARVMVLVFSSHANASGHIPKEVERAVSNGVAIIPFRIEDVSPGKSLDYFIGSVHWLDAMSPPMEKHLDELASTVHKLLPMKPGGQGVPAADTSAIWTRSVSMAGSAAAPATAKSAPASRPDPSSKIIWIGVAAVVVMAAIIIGVVMIRVGSSPTPVSQSATTSAPNLSTGAAAATNSNPPSNAGTPNVATTPAAGAENPARRAAPRPTAKAIADPIVGCYQWFNNQPVSIGSDGAAISGPLTGHWQVVSPERREYLIRWPKATDTVTVARMQKNLKGANQYGFSVLGTRLSGTGGIVGSWRWTNGVTLTASEDGTFSAATFRGTWIAVDASRGIYALTWPEPVDSLTLSADGSHLSGQNQYGVPISGTKTGPCAGN